MIIYMQGLWRFMLCYSQATLKESYNKSGKVA